MFINLTKFQLDIHGRKGVHQNGFFIYSGGSNCLVHISRIVCCSLDPVCHWMYYFMYFLQIQWHFLNSKKGNWVHLGWIKCIGINNCY